MLFSAFVFNLWILKDATFITDTVCKLVFAEYSNLMPQFKLYSAYYQLGLWGMLFISAIGVINSKDSLGRRKLGQVLLGTMAFVLPAMLFVIAFEPAKGALSSIMCHFALLLAVFLTRLLYIEKNNPILQEGEDEE